MPYLITKENFIKSLRKRKNLSIDEKAKKLEEFDNIVLCPYKGHKIDLSKLTDSQRRSEEYRCPECDEWIWWNRNLPWFQQAAISIN